MNTLDNDARNTSSTLKLYFLLILLCVGLYLPGINTLPLVDRDSSHFVQATRQMLETGNYFQIRFQEKTRFQKPPGINWLQAGSVKLFSTPEATAIWPYRLPSLLGGILAVLLTFTFARLFWNNTIAFLASALLASTLLLTIEAHLAVTDATLLACVIAMQGALGWIYLQYQNQKEIPVKTANFNAPIASQVNSRSSEKKGAERNRVLQISTREWLAPFIFWFALSLGFLIKGVTPLFAIVTIVTLSLWDRDIRWLKGLKAQWGIPLLVISSCWLILVSFAENSNYLDKMIQKDLLPKLISGHESHGGLPGYHLLLSPLTLWPASLFLLPAVIWTWRSRHLPTVKFLLAWLIPAWLFFELMPTKLPQYVLPTFPVICILAALAIYQTTITKESTRPSGWLNALYLGWGFLGIVLALALFSLPLLLQQPINLFTISAAIIVLMTASLGIYLSYQSKLLRGAWTVIIGALLSYALIFHFIIPSLSPLWLSNKIAHAIQQYAPKKISATQPLLASGYQEPSLVFMLGTQAVKFIEPEDLTALLSSPQNNLILVENKHLALLPKAREIARLSGFNYSKGKWMDLVIIEQETGSKDDV